MQSVSRLWRLLSGLVFFPLVRSRHGKLSHPDSSPVFSEWRCHRSMSISQAPPHKVGMGNHHHYTAHETSLYCSEENVGGDEFDEQYSYYPCSDAEANVDNNRVIKSPDLWDEQELTWLLEREQLNPLSTCLEGNPALESGRREAVEWILKVNSHYSFSPLTALLAVNYFDRFLFSCRSQNAIPWMTQLAAVASLSLAAKFEETHVPLLLDLQVEDTTYLFEPKTIKRMEILLLSTLGWKMNPPTPLSFLHYVTTRLASKNYHLCSDFLTNCQSLLLSILPDSTFMSYLPSELASATMLHLVKSLEPRLEAEYKRRLFGILGMDKEKVKECCKMMMRLWSGCEEQGKQWCMKRKFGLVPGSPNGVMDVCFSCDSSNDSWAVAAASVSSSPEPLSKKSRAKEELLPNRL
ncbi:hypothetical protein VNO78_00547 [Psophocarpus tetragonolobus]|uniref:B-like cyclin n=1 Tax=Psophocarpus tetragonolobus TaxID=3891 RepID=A0AAN9T0M5_PSOTE